MHATYELKNREGKTLYGQCWIPDSVSAVLCHIHGQSDHSERYRHVGEYMQAHNIAFFSADLIGHGKSEGQRGHVSNFYEYTETAELLYNEARKKFPATPIFIYGHSLGGNIALNHSFYTHENIAGYIITSPWIRLAFEPPGWKIALGKTVKSIFPALTQPTGLDTRLISRDPEVVKKYEDDPMVHGKITAGCYFEILSNGKNILLKADQLKYPVLLMHSSADKITSHIASRELAAMRPDLITYKEFENMYHEIHNEPEKEEVFLEMINWIKKVLG